MIVLMTQTVKRKVFTMATATKKNDLAFRQRDAILELVNLAKRAEDLKRRAADFQAEIECPDATRLAKPEDLYTWAINDVESFLRNINFATLARCCKEV
jgi:hypothetical protein